MTGRYELDSCFAGKKSIKIGFISMTMDNPNGIGSNKLLELPDENSVIAAPAGKNNVRKAMFLTLMLQRTISTIAGIQQADNRFIK